MADLPDWMWLAAADEGAVALICDHDDCRPRSAEDMASYGEIAYHGGCGDGPNDDSPYADGDKPYFPLDQLGVFAAFMYQHAASHAAQAGRGPLAPESIPGTPAARWYA